MRSPDPEAGSPGPSPTSPALPPPASAYWRFYDEVAAAQLAAWAPTRPSRVLDLSGAGARFATQLRTAGHDVLPATGEPPGAPGLGDSRDLSWVADAGVDAVLAESRALSLCLATEETARDLVRVLRPGGRLLLVVDSLVTGLSRLADQGRWAELADVPAADVVLVPDHDGSISRCFWPQELRDLLEASGLDVEWVRPRTVLTPAAVERAVEQGGEAALRILVTTELALAQEREGDASGMHLVASARRPL